MLEQGTALSQLAPLPLASVCKGSTLLAPGTSYADLSGAPVARQCGQSLHPPERLAGGTPW